MKTTVIVLAICLSAAYAASINKDEAPSVDNRNSYSVLLSMMKGQNIVRHCGGARLSREWFITAAECLDQTKADKIMLMFSTNAYDNIPIPFELESVEHVIHPEYDGKKKTNNLALIRCEACGQQAKDELPRVPSKNDENISYSPEPAFVTGVIDNANQAPVLPFDVQSLPTIIVHPFWCKFYYFFTSVGGNHICASNVGGKGLSKDDVGAPLVIREATGVLKIVGIATSIVPWTSLVSMPLVFTRISSYTDWIGQVTNILQ